MIDPYTIEQINEDLKTILGEDFGKVLEGDEAAKVMRRLNDLLNEWSEPRATDRDTV